MSEKDYAVRVMPGEPARVVNALLQAAIDIMENEFHRLSSDGRRDLQFGTELLDIANSAITDGLRKVSSGHA